MYEIVPNPVTDAACEPVFCQLKTPPASSAQVALLLPAFHAQDKSWRKPRNRGMLEGAAGIPQPIHTFQCVVSHEPQSLVLLGHYTLKSVE
jgi:hypothetical protein